MDKNLLLSKLNKLLPGVVLESRRFGRSGVVSVWVEAQSLTKVGVAMKEDPELSADWLENLSIVEFEEALVVTYFVRSTGMGHSFIVRASVVPNPKTGSASFPSVQSVWPMAKLMEREAEEMFGVTFGSESLKSEPAGSHFGILPEGWTGYPLRKKYEFPKEVFGILHSRPSNKIQLKKTK